MTTISERLRGPIGSVENESTGAVEPLFSDLRIEAADTIDALIWVLEKMGDNSISEYERDMMRRAALAKAKSCHTGNSARGNAMKDEA